jgi:diguanylate cyclase (GGDEF)-like protein
MEYDENLFRVELDVLTEAKKIPHFELLNEKELYDEFQKLLYFYEKNLKSMMKLTKISDSQQNYLQDIQEELRKEIFEREKIERKLEYYAFTDPLTNTSNRRTGLMVFEKLIKSSSRNNEPLTICFIDIDGLKRVNDTYGHNEGDNLIKSIAMIISSSLRDVDTISRLGGDEFLLILPNCNAKNAEMIMQRIRGKMHRYNLDSNKPYSLSFSCGIEQVSCDEASNVDEIIKRADENMYLEKISKSSSSKERSDE